MAFNIISKLSMVAAGATLLVGTTVETVTYGQTQAALPSQVVGTWTTTQTTSVPKGTATITETITIARNGRFQYANSSTAPFLNNCTLTASGSISGKASVTNLPTLTITTTRPSSLTVQSSCSSKPISQKTIPALQGDLSWRRADDNTGEKLCLKGNLSSPGSKSFTIPINNCYYRK